jgi:hypothetical protein
MRRLIAFAFVTVIASAGIARADEPPPWLVPQPAAEARALRKRRVGAAVMTGVGFTVFAASYLPLAGIAIDTFAHGTDDPTARWMMAPVIGPFVVGGQLLASPPDAWFRDLDRVVGALLLFDGVAQAAGLVIGIVGAATLRATRAEAPPRLTLAPVISPSLTGLSLTARF